MHRWCLLNLTVQGFSLNLTVRGVSNKDCLLTFFIVSYVYFLSDSLIQAHPTINLSFQSGNFRPVKYLFVSLQRSMQMQKKK